MPEIVYQAGTTGTSGQIWYQWNNSTTAACTTNFDSNGNGVWAQWTSTSSAMTSCSNSIYQQSSGIWGQWVRVENNYPQGTRIPFHDQHVLEWYEIERIRLTPHTAHIQSYQAEKWRIAEEERKRKEAAAEARANELLLRHLTKDQGEMYKKEKKFVVYGEDGKSYQVGYGWSGNVVEMSKDGKPVKRYCIHPAQQIPIPDHMLSQKLMLETDSKRFREVANATAIR